MKVAHLKNLQGILWARGYSAGELLTPLYDDVVPTLETWRAGPGGVELAIFSSGSVGAQKMFFGHVGVEDGDVRDLRPWFEPRWFDTVNAGPKFDEGSYAKIVGSIGVEAGQALFLSDHIKGTLCNVHVFAAV